MSLFWIYICIEENNNRQSASPRWNTSVILFMHLSLLALLPCVLSLGGPACCAPESWHAQAEGRRSSGGKIGGFMSTQREPALSTCSGPSPVRQCSFHGHLLPDLQERRGGLVGEKFLWKEKTEKGCVNSPCSIQSNMLIKISRQLHSASSLALKVDLKLQTLYTECINV